MPMPQIICHKINKCKYCATQYKTNNYCATKYKIYK